MSLAGFKKQFNKTSQFLSEKVSGAEGSKKDEEFMELEKKTDSIDKCIHELQSKANDYLQPNPNARTKMSMAQTVAKARGQVKSSKYPQPESAIGEVCQKAADDMIDGPYAEALSSCAETFTQLGESKDTLEFHVKQNFLDPLYQFSQKDIKEINAHRKKLESRRLDYDYKVGKGDKVPAEELQMAKDKFDESNDLCYNSMMNLIDSDVEHIGHLHAFVTAIRDYHQECARMMDSLVDTLDSKLSQASSRPKSDRRSINIDKISTSSYDDIPSGHSQISAPVNYNQGPPLPAAPIPSRQTPSAKALYDFDPENEGELEFREGDMIELTGRIDENWLEGKVHGKAGYFPENYVEIVVPL